MNRKTTIIAVVSALAIVGIIVGIIFGVTSGGNNVEETIKRKQGLWTDGGVLPHGGAAHPVAPYVGGAVIVGAGIAVGIVIWNESNKRNAVEAKKQALTAGGNEEMGQKQKKNQEKEYEGELKKFFDVTHSKKQHLLSRIQARRHEMHSRLKLDDEFISKICANAHHLTKKYRTIMSITSVAFRNEDEKMQAGYQNGCILNFEVPLQSKIQIHATLFKQLGNQPEYPHVTLVPSTTTTEEEDNMCHLYFLNNSLNHLIIRAEEKAHCKATLDDIPNQEELTVSLLKAFLAVQWFLTRTLQ